jgi:transposase/putative transposase
MKAKRKRHSPAFKAKVAMEALIGVKTVAQIARENNVHPIQVSQWKTTLREHMFEVFDTDRKEAENQEELIAALHQKIGQLTVDLDWLKKKSKQLGL